MAAASTIQVVVEVDGYYIAERLLEGVMYAVTVEVASDVDVESRFAFGVVDVAEARANDRYMRGFTASQRAAWVDQVRQYVRDMPDVVWEDLELPA